MRRRNWVIAAVSSIGIAGIAGVGWAADLTVAPESTAGDARQLDTFRWSNLDVGHDLDAVFTGGPVRVSTTTPAGASSVDLVVEMTGAYSTSRNDPASLRLGVKNADGTTFATAGSSIRLAPSWTQNAFSARWVITNVPAGSHELTVTPTTFDVNHDDSVWIRMTRPVLTVESWTS